MLRLSAIATLSLLPLIALAQDDSTTKKAERPSPEATENTADEGAEVEKAEDEGAVKAARTDPPAEPSEQAKPEPMKAERPAEPEPEPEPKAEPKPEPKPKPTTEWKASGLYTMWGLTQQNFLFGKKADPTDRRSPDHPLDDTQYIVQMLRIQTEVTKGQVGAVARLDAGQGWWGVNNDFNHMDVTVIDPTTGAATEVNAYNENAMFGNKDTNYTVHFDHVYGWGDFKAGNVNMKLRVGRQYYGLGHKLVLDQDWDGIQLDIVPADNASVTVMYAKVSEGRGSFKDPVGLLMNDTNEGWGDADFFGAQAKFGGKDSAHKGEVFGAYYLDRSALDDWTFLPNELGYFRSRFQPNVSSLTAIGVAGEGKFGAKDDPGLSWKGEADFLIGRDEVDNADHAGGLLDVNDGSIMGFNAYLDLKQGFAVAKGMDAGLILGFGSGDADKTGGAGNVNKIQTMGFFPFTNVWEDSVMPDVEGISPQGLGSPVSRGYREFENTIAAQVNYGINLSKPLRLDASYTYLNATTPIQGFDATGTPTGKGASDLGMEIDANITIKFNNSIVFKSLGGIFLPGEAGALLINGNTDAMDPAWEIKNVFLVKF